jgi:hypothetical protein
MRSRLPSWILLFYLAIDLANPFVPGAFQFTPQEGLVWVEGAYLSRQGTEAGRLEATETAPPARTQTSLGAVCAALSSARARDLTAWLVGVRTGDPPAHDFPPPDSDDH